MLTRICTLAMLRAELNNAMLYGCRGEKVLGCFLRNTRGTVSYNWF